MDVATGDKGGDALPAGFDRSAAGVALWASVADSLRRRVAAGELAERFPTEAELVAQYEVSRATVRQAIRQLRIEGLVEARQGAGTFVLERQLDEPLLGRLGLARMIEGAGLDERSKLLRAEPGEAGTAAAVALGCDRRGPAVHLDRLRFAGDEVIALDRSVILIGGGSRRRLLAAPLDRGSLYDLLAEHAGVTVDGGREEVRAVTCPTADRRLLELRPGDGVLELQRFAYAGGSPVEWRTSVLKGAHYVFGTSWGVLPVTGPPR